MTDQASASHNTDEPWCNCQAIPGTVNYPGPWHPQYDPVSCKTTRVARVSAGCAGTPGAHVADEQTTVHAVSTVDDITDDMVERGVRALTEPTGEVYSVQASDKASAKQAVLQVLSAALAGYTVAPDSAPTGESVDGERYWWTALSTITTGLNLADKPFVRIDGEFFDVDEVEADALARLAAAREARRLAAGSQVGDQHGE